MMCVQVLMKLEKFPDVLLHRVHSRRSSRPPPLPFLLLLVGRGSAQAFSWSFTPGTGQTLTTCETVPIQLTPGDSGVPPYFLAAYPTGDDGQVPQTQEIGDSGWVVDYPAGALFACGARI